MATGTSCSHNPLQVSIIGRYLPEEETCKTCPTTGDPSPEFWADGRDQLKLFSGHDK